MINRIAHSFVNLIGKKGGIERIFKSKNIQTV